MTAVSMSVESAGTAYTLALLRRKSKGRRWWQSSLLSWSPCLSATVVYSKYKIRHTNPKNRQFMVIDGNTPI